MAKAAVRATRLFDTDVGDGDGALWFESTKQKMKNAFEKAHPNDVGARYQRLKWEK